MNISVKQKEINKFMLMILVFGFATFLCCYQHIVRLYNSTMLALSYEYGFTSRSLIGTIYHLVDKILPVDMIDYSMAMRFAQVTTALFFAFLYIFIYLCLKRCKEEYLKPCEYLIVFFILISISTFSAGYNFFRVDLFLVIVCLLSALLIVYEKAEWLVIPLSAIGVMFHQGFVFMFFNVALVLLAYKFLISDKKGKWKYGTIFSLSFLLGSALFLWFEFFSRSNGELFFEQIVTEAQKLSHNGEYHVTLLDHEVLGIDLTGVEADLRIINIVQFPIFFILFLPYTIFTVQFFKGLLKRTESFVDSLKYWIVIIGAGTMLPNFILKLDYGRWIFAVMVYYLVVILALVMMHDKNVEEQVLYSYNSIKSKPWAVLFVMYPIFFVPLWDVDINGFMEEFGPQIYSMFVN